MSNNKKNDFNVDDEYLKNLLPEDDFLGNNYFTDENIDDDEEDDFSCDCDENESHHDFYEEESCEHHHEHCNDECCEEDEKNVVYKNIDVNDVDVKQEIDKLVNKLSNVELDEDIIIVVSNSYISKYYINPKIEKSLPKEVKDDLKALLVTITEKNGGIIEVHYVDSEMEIYLKTYSSEDDFLYDEIGAKSDLSKIEIQYREMFEQIAAVCKVSLRDMFK